MEQRADGKSHTEMSKKVKLPLVPVARRQGHRESVSISEFHSHSNHWSSVERTYIEFVMQGLKH